ncbi:MAG: redoxin domain-containing protein [Pirellulales bacterium]
MSLVRLFLLTSVLGLMAYPHDARGLEPAETPKTANAASIASNDALRKEVHSILRRVRNQEFHPVHNGFTIDALQKTHGIADLADEDWRVRLVALRDLLRLGAASVPVLIEALDDNNLHVRHICCFALGLLPEEDGEQATVSRAAVRALQTLLQRDTEPIVRSQAAVSLGRLGAHSSSTLLEEAAKKDLSRDVQHQCMLAVDRIRKNAQHDDVLAAFKSLDESTFNTLEVGKPALDFSLTDTNGDKWRLSDWRGKKTVLLIWIFADWCPVCHREFRDLIELKQDLVESDVAVATIECHDLYRSRVMVGKEAHPRYWFTKQSPQALYTESLWWTHLSDPAGSVGARYGVAPFAFAVHSEFVNRPSTIIIDKSGLVRFAYYGTFWGDRPSIRQTLDMIKSGVYSFEHPRRLKTARQ